MEQRVNRKKFIRYKEGAKLYSMSQSQFERLSKEAGATYKIGKMVLVNCDIFDGYLESFKTVQGSFRANTESDYSRHFNGV